MATRVFSPNYELPVGTVQFLKFTVDEINLLPWMGEMKMYQSILRPFIVCDFFMRDFDGIGNVIDLKGGEPVSVSVISREGYLMEWNGNVTKQNGETDTDQRQQRGTVITATNSTFHYNEANKVTLDRKGVPGTNVIQEIHQRFLGGGTFSRIDVSNGMIAEEEPYHIRDEKPFDAIAKIRYAITSSSNPRTGGYAYYRDIDGYVLYPLEKLLSEAKASAPIFIQNELKGLSAMDIIIPSDTILDFKAMTTFGGSTGASIAASLSRVQADEWKWMDANNFLPGTPMTAALQGVAKAFESSKVGVRNFFVNDTRINKISPQSVKANGEKRVAESIQNGPGYKMAVLFDLGVNLTCGKGVDGRPLVHPESIAAHLPGTAGGPALIVNLTHTLKNILETRPQGITVVECAKGME